jgi:hypothetical protein
MGSLTQSEGAPILDALAESLIFGKPKSYLPEIIE